MINEHDVSYHAIQPWLRTSHNSPYNLPDDLAHSIEKVMKDAHSYLMTVETNRAEQLSKDFPEVVSLARTYGDIHPFRKECLVPPHPIGKSISLERTRGFAQFMADYGIEEMRRYHEDLVPEMEEAFSCLNELVVDQSIDPCQTEIVTADTSEDDPDDEKIAWRV